MLIFSPYPDELEDELLEDELLDLEELELLELLELDELADGLEELELDWLEELELDEIHASALAIQSVIFPSQSFVRFLPRIARPTTDKR